MTTPRTPYSPNHTKPLNDDFCDLVVVARKLKGQPTRTLSRAENIAVAQRMKARGDGSGTIATFLSMNTAACKALMAEGELTQ